MLIRIATTRFLAAVFCLSALLLCPLVVRAEVVRVEVLHREGFAGGQEFENVGAYEKIIGKLHYEVDPEHPANKGIVDLSLAPRTPAGRVAFSGEFFLLAPKDPKRGNGVLLYDVNNRGNKLALHAFNGVGGNDPSTAADAGNGFLMKQGYAILWSGWNGDVQPGEKRLQFEPPVATQPEGPITGRIYSEICVDKQTTFAPLCGGNTRVYPSVDVADPTAILSVRPYRTDEPTIVPREDWSFARVEDGRVIADPTSLYIKNGIKPGWLYDLVYTGKNPRVSGLGFAAVRDGVAFFRYGTQTEGTQANPLAGHIKHAYGFGISQSGRFLQDLVYQDFNGDEHGRMVFDAFFVHVAAAGRTVMNQRFAQITRHGSQHEENLYPTDTFPFTTTRQEDMLSHRHGDWLERSRASGHLPKLFLTQTSTEYFGRGGSLLHTDVLAQHDVGLDPAVHLYHIAGGQHLFSTPKDPGPATYPLNTLNYTPLMRALLVCMDEWVRDGREPPESSYPRIADRTLISLERYREVFPPVRTVAVPQSVYAPLQLDLGARYETRGIVDCVPPKIGASYRVLVPVVDRDGNEIAGIRLPQVAVPIATYVGWNTRAEAFGAPGALTRWTGSAFPFTRTREERMKTDDPRPSILERYPTREDYVERVQQACEELRERRLMLDEDVENTIQEARKLELWSGQ